MLEKIASPAYVAAQLQARHHRDHHEFGLAARRAEDAATIARSDGDFLAEWDMKFFQTETLLDAGEFDEAASLAVSLVDKPPAVASGQAKARAYILLAIAKQRAGLLDEAVESARMGAELTPGDDDLEINVKARQALIAALADCGKLAEAWAECQKLGDVISDDLDDQLAGKAYWVIGNVAFLCNRADEGLRFHELAASTFSPARNLDVWAKFNKASAAMRLAADIADADTLRCIERAELATDVIGGSANDYLLLKLNRAHWSYLAGDLGGAIEVLSELCANEDGISPQRSGEACLLLGRAHLAQGDTEAARRPLSDAVTHFERAGATLRAQQARDFLRAELGRASFWSWLVRVMGFDRN
ncbi:hypothetical protein ABLI39_08950 [Pseudarthrobacter sp. B907]|uniref:hypothetical protein n=1 Tax=Pseudarthrobacter sp. B907 TaxID=3158261 RepID=UPI0032DA8CB6